jgi:hypothetical protein
MQSRSDKTRFTSEIKNTKYIDDYIGRWLKLEALDDPYVECEICGYVSNASIHQRLFPEEFGSNSKNNRIVHLCANCCYELHALIDKQSIAAAPERMLQMCEDAFERLKGKKKHYKDANKNLERIEI